MNVNVNVNVNVNLRVMYEYSRCYALLCSALRTGTVEWDEFLRLMKRYLKRRAGSDEDEEFREAFTVCYAKLCTRLLGATS